MRMHNSLEMIFTRKNAESHVLEGGMPGKKTIGNNGFVRKQILKKIYLGLAYLTQNHLMRRKVCGWSIL